MPRTDDLIPPIAPVFDDLDDPRDSAQRDEDRTHVDYQIANFAKRVEEPFRRELVHWLMQRRSEHPELVTFEVLPNPHGPGVFVTAGELLIRASAYRDENVVAFLKGEGFRPAPVEALRDEVVRLVSAEIEPPRLAAIAQLLRGQGVPAAMSYISPLGPVAKGYGGPEPSAGMRPFPGGEPAAPVVAFIDTGITAEIRTDYWLTDVVRDQGNVDGLDLLPQPDGFLDFAAGHGTFAAGALQQVAPGAEIRMYRCIDTDGIGRELDVAGTMIEAVEDGARILNLSLGTQTLGDQPPLAFQVALEIIDEWEREHEEQVLIVAAAGNFGDTRPCWPAAFRRVVAVAGLTAQCRPAAWSTRGFWVDCSAIAEGMLSTYVEGVESPLIDLYPDRFPADAWAVWTGTSFAAPQVAGAVARICQRDGLEREPRTALRRLLERGTPIPDFGVGLRILPGT